MLKSVRRVRTIAQHHESVFLNSYAVSVTFRSFFCTNARSHRLGSQFGECTTKIAFYPRAHARECVLRAALVKVSASESLGPSHIGVESRLREETLPVHALCRISTIRLPVCDKRRWSCARTHERGNNCCAPIWRNESAPPLSSRLDKKTLAGMLSAVLYYLCVSCIYISNPARI